MGLRSRLLKLAYQLHRHEVSGRPLDRWLGILLVFIGLLGVPGWLPGGRLTALLAAVVLAGLIAFEVWARRASYVQFISQGPPVRGPQPGNEILRPEDKIPIRATGQFEVEGRSRFFADLQAFFRTFATREHAVMAYAPPSRFLWLARWPDDEVGMWYIFFQPGQVVEVESGLLVFGSTRCPALRITYEEKERDRTIYLSFECEEDRQRVWDDVLHDAASEDARP